MVFAFTFFFFLFVTLQTDIRLFHCLKKIISKCACLNALLLFFCFLLSVCVCNDRMNAEFNRIHDKKVFRCAINLSERRNKIRRGKKLKKEHWFEILISTFVFFLLGLCFKNGGICVCVCMTWFFSGDFNSVWITFTFLFASF